MKNLLIISMKIFVTLTIFWILFKDVTIDSFLSNIFGFDASLIFTGILLLFLLNFSIAVRWGIILRCFGLNYSLSDLSRFTLIGAFFNQVFPTGMGGDVFRVWYVRKFGAPLDVAVSSVLLDRFSGLLGVSVITLAGAPYIFAVINSEEVRILLLIFVLLLLSVAGFVVLTFSLRSAFTKLTHFCKFVILAVRLDIILFVIHRIRLFMGRLIINYTDGLLIVFLSTVNQLCLGLVVFLISKAIGSYIDLLSVLCAFPLVILISALPFSFAGWGLREGAMVVVFASLGVPKETSLVISIVFGVSLFLSSLVGAGLWLIRTQENSSLKRDLSGSNRV